MGARVFATASEAKIGDVRSLGADTVFDYRGEDFEQGVLRETANRGVDAIIDFVGGN